MERVAARATWHALSFGEHYDPDRLRWGPIVCHDEHLLGRGQGFATHRHDELEIVTWVLSGAVTHEDTLGSAVTLTPGAVGHLTAGTGVSHSEVAAAPQTRFVQVWLAPQGPGRTPAYSSTEVAIEPGRLCDVLRPDAGATFSVARLAAGESITVPPADLRHLYVATGALLRSSLAEPLSAGDAFVIDGEDAQTPVDITAAVPTELLVWRFR
ncbi:pirin family protein [Nocardioides sp. BP30]|uniref:pirin family protein n=1 Tax=Nocardioides sp. BP30 TaxID=3036374 RepID=UPI0024692344|nr:pirin family protein [Nocardioides sp. BP30]WGL52689.1 pirin family protein [Nocardioides sp. BP30]